MRMLVTQAQAQADAAFDAGTETHSVRLVMKRMQARAVQKSRPKFTIGMVAKLKMLGASMKKKVRALCVQRQHAAHQAESCARLGAWHAADLSCPCHAAGSGKGCTSGSRRESCQPWSVMQYQLQLHNTVYTVAGCRLEDVTDHPESHQLLKIH